jgi:hypothetical protein
VQRTFAADAFVASCLEALAEPDPVAVVSELVEREVRDCGETIGTTIETLYSSPELTVQRLCWGRER